MRRLFSAIPVGLQWLTRVTKQCVRECVSKYRVFLQQFSASKTLSHTELTHHSTKVFRSSNLLLRGQRLLPNNRSLTLKVEVITPIGITDINPWECTLEPIGMSYS